MSSKHILLLITLLALLSYAVWEYFVAQWAKSQSGAIIRVDLLLIYPALLILIGATAIQFWRESSRQN